MVQIPSCLHSTFKDISNEYSHAQIRVKMKKLWPRQIGEEKQVAVRKYVATRKVCRDRKYFATGSMSRPVSRKEVCRDQCRDKEVCRDQCRDQKALSRPKTLRNPKKKKAKN